MKCKLVRPIPTYVGPNGQKHKVVQPVGAVIDLPKAYRLVRAGVAVPLDEECSEAANVTQDEWVIAQEAYDQAARGMGYASYPDERDVEEEESDDEEVDEESTCVTDL